MSEIESPKYLVRDPQGNVYGPADLPTLREWVGQGRIVAGMHIAPRESREWVDVTQHPGLADLFGGAVVVQGVPEETVTAKPVMPGDGPAARVEQQVVRVDALRDPQSIGTMGYETPQRRGNTLSRLAMIFGILSPCLGLAGCIPFCGCVALPLGCLAALAAIVLGITVRMQLRQAPDDAARREATIGIWLGGITLLLVIGLVIVGIILSLVQPAAMPLVPPAPPVPAPVVVPGPPPAPERP